MPITNATMKLVGEDGNAFAIMARAERAMKRANVDPVTIQMYRNEATAADYAHLLATTMKYVRCDVADEEE